MGAMSSKETWMLLETKYVLPDQIWLAHALFRQLTRQLSPGGNVLAHVSGFQEAICHLVNFQIPSYIAANILLSTLPSDPNDPASWNNHVPSVKIDKTTTTFSSVIAGILEEKY